MTPTLIKRTDSFNVSLFWIPGLIGLVGVLLGVILPHLDAAGYASPWLPEMDSYLVASTEGARELLSSGAAVLATILAVAFSITMLTQQLAAGQYSPLVLRRFVGDTVTQVALGMYLGGVAYLLLAVRSLPYTPPGASQASTSVPHLTVIGGGIIIVACLGMIAYFINHSARSVQAETIVRQVGFETVRTARRLPSSSQGSEHDVDLPSEPGWQLSAPSPGYLQIIDEDALLRAAPPGCRFIRVEMRTGDFLFAGLPLLTLWPGKEPDEKTKRALRNCFGIGRERILRQDLLLGVRELVDIALRSLSSDLNDPTTAIQALNELGAVNESVIREGLVGTHDYRLRRNDGTALLIPRISLDKVLVHSFHEIPQAAGTQVRVTARVLEILADLMMLTDSAQAHEALQTTGTFIRKVALRHDLSTDARRLLDSRFRMLTGAARAVEGGDASPALH